MALVHPATRSHNLRVNNSPSDFSSLFKGRHFDSSIIILCVRKWNRYARPVSSPWRVDEPYIRVKGEWRYLYRAVDKQGSTVDFLLTQHRDIAAAKLLPSGLHLILLEQIALGWLWDVLQLMTESGGAFVTGTAVTNVPAGTAFWLVNQRRRNEARSSVI